MRMLGSRFDTTSGRGSVGKRDLDVHEIAFFSLHRVLSLELLLTFAIVLNLSIVLLLVRGLQLSFSAHRSRSCTCWEPSNTEYPDRLATLANIFNCDHAD
jgi:hypothetical protein